MVMVVGMNPKANPAMDTDGQNREGVEIEGQDLFTYLPVNDI